MQLEGPIFTPLPKNTKYGDPFIRMKSQYHFAFKVMNAIDKISSVTSELEDYSLKV